MYEMIMAGFPENAGSRSERKETDMANGNEKREISFEIRKHLGILSHRNTGWTRELNLVAWNGQQVPKFDIRDWSADHTHMGRGITLFLDEMEKLQEYFHGYQIGDQKELGSMEGSGGSDKESSEILAMEKERVRKGASCQETYREEITEQKGEGLEREAEKKEEASAKKNVDSLYSAKTPDSGVSEAVPF